MQNFGPGFGKTTQARGEKGLKSPADEPGKQNDGGNSEERRRVGTYPRCGHKFSLTAEDAEDTEKTPGVMRPGVFHLAVFSIGLGRRGDLALSPSTKAQPFPSLIIFHSAFCILRFGKLGFSPSSSALSALSAVKI